MGRIVVCGLALFLLGLALIGWHAVRTAGPFGFNRIKRHDRRRSPGPAAASFMASLTVISSRDVFALFFAVLVVAGFPLAMLYLFAVAASIWGVFVAASVLPSHTGLLAPGDAWACRAASCHCPARAL